MSQVSRPRLLLRRTWFYSSRRPLPKKLGSVSVNDLAVLFVVEGEVVVATRQPLTDSPLPLNTIKGLHSIPCNPLVGTFFIVAGRTGRDYVASAILAAPRLRPHMIHCEACVVNRRASAVGTTVSPRVFDTLPPLLTGLSPCQCSHVKKVVGNPLVQGEVSPSVDHGSD